jgi:two-component system chemotaxis response regulator CheB
MDFTAREIDIVVIGSSAGGVAALKHIVRQLPPTGFPVPVVIVQHCLPSGAHALTSILAMNCPIPVKLAENGERLISGCIYVAPAGRHLAIQERGFLTLIDDEKIRFSRPSIDMLFKSAAIAYHGRVLGVILTGANDDGAQGARLIDLLGGIVIGQDRAEHTRMPAAAAATGAVDHLLPIENIASAIVALCMMPGAASWMQRYAVS